MSIINVKCLNLHCNNVFVVYQSEYKKRKKLYCSRKCRSEHHWLVTPMYEKSCLNCGDIMKRKFIQQLDRLKYCSVKCRKNHKLSINEERKNDTILSNCKTCNIELKTKRENCGKLISRKRCDVCLKLENSIKANNMTVRNSFLYETDSKFREKRKLTYVNTGKKLKQKYEIDGPPKLWMDWYKKFSKFGKSKIEDRVADFINTKSINIERWYQISNVFVDIYVPEKRLVIECLGNYWHMNPNKYKETDFNRSTKRTAKEQWDKDSNRRFFLESQGYKVVEIWEDEINKGDLSKLDIYLHD